MATPKVPVELHPSGVAYVYTAEEIDRRIGASGGIKGDPGPKGDPGYTPIRGLDYFNGERGVSAGLSVGFGPIDGGLPGSFYAGAVLNFGGVT